MKKHLLLFISIVALCTVSAQERPSFNSTTYDHFTTDVQENLYCWKGSSLDKYSNAGKLAYHFSQLQYGEITSVCASIASKTVVFYKESGIILLLDNKLAPIGNPLNLFEHNLFTISLVAMTGTNQLALYDEVNQNLIITDLNLNILTKTFCDFGPEFRPTVIETQLDKSILLADSSCGIFLFDKYGTYDKRIAMPNISQMQYYGNMLLLLKENELFAYTFPSMELQRIDINQKTSQFRIGKSQLFYLDPSGRITSKTFIID